MAKIRWDQVNFTRGELDPRVQCRTDWPNYYKAAKYIRNCVSIPQGGVTRRWGTEFVDNLMDSLQLLDASQFNDVEITVFSFSDTTTYLLVWSNNNLLIYLENKLLATIALTAAPDVFGGMIYTKEDIVNLRFTQASRRLIITDGNHQPMQLRRSANAAVAISAFSAANSTCSATIPNSAVNIGKVYPVRFTYTDMPFTTPQIFADRDYFIRITALDTFKIYSTSENAINDISAYTLTIFVANTVQLLIQNTWGLSTVSFTNVPTHDFDHTYLSKNILFTPVVAGGNATITVSAATTAIPLPVGVIFFTAAMVGGIFSGNEGIVRITTVNVDGLSATGTVVNAFSSALAITGDLCYIGEPAWSNARGWPRCPGMFQGRLVMASTAEIPNGQWLSIINELYDFDETQTGDDNAIASYPASGSISYIKAITSARSLLIHTSAANYSTQIQNEIALTPKNYLLLEHNKFGVGNVQPVYIDNQLLFIDSSGNNVINMNWDFIQGNYVTNNISIAASTLIRNPTDMASFSEPKYLDGFYVLFINNDGTLCVLQTLKEEDILAFSLSNTNTYLTTDQSNGYTIISSSYLKVVSSQNRCWMLVSREIVPAFIPGGNPLVNSLNIAGIGNNYFVNNDNLVTIGTIYRATFEFTPPPAVPHVPPVTIPAVSEGVMYFVAAVPGSPTHIAVYSSLDDAKNNTNAYTFVQPGSSNCYVRTYESTTELFLEEVDFDYYTDFSITRRYPIATTVIDGLNHLNGQVVKVVSVDPNDAAAPTVAIPPYNQYVLQDRTVVNGSITIERLSTIVKIGLPYQSMLVPLPPVVPEQPGMLFNPRHIRTLYIAHYNTVGATIQGYGIPTQYLGNVELGAPINVTAGNQVFTYTPMEGWGAAFNNDGLTANDLQIIQEQPLPMTITGLSYIIDISK